MKLDLDMLVMRLMLEQEGTVLPQASCNEYLISQVLLPLLRGEPVPLRTIDYGAFDEADISALAEYNDAVYRIAQALGQTVERIGAIAPVARSARQFC